MSEAKPKAKAKAKGEHMNGANGAGKSKGKRALYDSLIQTLVPKAAHDAITSLAEREGISTAAYMRRMILVEVDKRVPSFWRAKA